MNLCSDFLDKPLPLERNYSWSGSVSSGLRCVPRRIFVPTGQAKNLGKGRLRRRYLARRLEILRAAGKEFRLRGFAETGMRDIASAADLSPANLYNYFKGKEEILFFCQDSALDRLIGALDKARRMRTNGATKLRLVITAHLRCVLDEVEGSAAHLVTATLPPRQRWYLVKKRDRYEEGMRNLIAAGVRCGEFAPCDPALAARALLGSLNWSVQWFKPEGTLTAAEIAEAFADYLIRGLLAKPDELKKHFSGRQRTEGIREDVLRTARERSSAG